MEFILLCPKMVQRSFEPRRRKVRQRGSLNINSETCLMPIRFSTWQEVMCSVYANGSFCGKRKRKGGWCESTGMVTAGLRGQNPPLQENKTMKRVIWRMMVAIEEMQGLDTSWRVSVRMSGTPRSCGKHLLDKIKIKKTVGPPDVFDLPRHQKYHSTPTCNSENQTLIQPPLWSWYCIMCWRAEGDDLIIVVFMDHWAAGLDFCYWIMGNSFFLLKEWLPNPIRQSAVLGQKAFTSQEQQQCHRYVRRKHSVGIKEVISV